MLGMHSITEINRFICAQIVQTLLILRDKRPSNQSAKLTFLSIGHPRATTFSVKGCQKIKPAFLILLVPAADRVIVEAKEFANLHTEFTIIEGWHSHGV